MTDDDEGEGLWPLLEEQDESELRGVPRVSATITALGLGVVLGVFVGLYTQPAATAFRPFLNFTVDPLLQPAGAVISLFTPHQDDLKAFFPDNDRYFFSPMSNHSDFVLFYTLFPYDAEHEVHHILTAELGCTEIQARPRPAYPLRLESVREFVSRLGTHIVTVPIAVNLPVHVHRDPGHLLRADWLGCHGVRKGLDYVLFSGAVFSHQLVFHPILSGYDYFIKHDLDVWWHHPPPQGSLFVAMQRQGCVWMHTFYNGYGTDCGLLAPEAVEEWARRTYGPGVLPASFHRRWWSSTDYFYGNLVGGWLGWVRSPENRELAEYLYENADRPGYFSRRWGDQPSFAKMLGMWFDIGDDQIRGDNVSSPVCDFSDLRDHQFEHN